ncbi:MAG: deoxyguanosinetriphosphate triphosphohydrolase [Rhodospirillaceae bacterium]|nr:deoxyguanosinetriphosphate triphosphohydrolase [Rhodospirillaceae bacterium]
MPAPFACRPGGSRGRRFDEAESPSRTPYQRDRDRVIHSGAFRKLQYKTQVFIYHEGDYYRTRLTHTLEVAQIARSIARTLELDEDLAEAIALAHDLGHTPFGHAGEDALSGVLQEVDPRCGGFRHNDQTVRVLTLLERRYAAFDGLNLTWETLEGVVKHNGPLVLSPAEAAAHPTILALDAAWGLDLARQPAAEAQVAALADDIAYMNHDIDDGLRAGLFDIADLSDLPLVGPAIASVERLHPGLERRRRTHEIVRRVIDRMVGDLVDESRRRISLLAPADADAIRRAEGPVISFSAGLRGDEQALRRFLFERMYRHYQVNRETSKARRIVCDLFGLLFREPICLPGEWQTLAVDMADGERARLVADYIAGMTDRYALLEHQRLFDLSPRL